MKKAFGIVVSGKIKGINQKSSYDYVHLIFPLSNLCKNTFFSWTVFSCVRADICPYTGKYVSAKTRILAYFCCVYTFYFYISLIHTLNSNYKCPVSIKIQLIYESSNTFTNRTFFKTLPKHTFSGDANWNFHYICPWPYSLIFILFLNLFHSIFLSSGCDNP